MDSRGSREIVRGNRFFATGESNLHVLQDGKHQLMMSNPDGFCQLLTDDLLGNIKFQYVIKKFSIRYTDDDGNETHQDTEYEEWCLERAQLNDQFMAKQKSMKIYTNDLKNEELGQEFDDEEERKEEDDTFFDDKK